MITEEARLVWRYELVRLSLPMLTFSARRFAPHPISPGEELDCPALRLGDLLGFRGQDRGAGY